MPDIPGSFQSPHHSLVLLFLWLGDDQCHLVRIRSDWLRGNRVRLQVDQLHQVATGFHLAGLKGKLDQIVNRL
jgi:hypothetical protein